MDDDEVQMDELWVDAGTRVPNHARGDTDEPPQTPLLSPAQAVRV